MCCPQCGQANLILSCSAGMLSPSLDFASSEDANLYWRARHGTIARPFSTIFFTASVQEKPFFLAYTKIPAASGARPFSRWCQ